MRAAVVERVDLERVAGCGWPAGGPCDTVPSAFVYVNESCLENTFSVSVLPAAPAVEARTAIASSVTRALAARMRMWVVLVMGTTLWPPRPPHIKASTGLASRC